MTGVGVVGSISVTKLTLNKFGANLPGLSATTTPGTKNMALLAYSVLIPGVVGILVRKYSRAFSDGLIIGGIANAAQIAVNAYAPADTKAALGFSEYLDAPAVRGLSAPIGAPGYSGVRAFGRNGGSPLASASPFPASNW